MSEEIKREPGSLSAIIPAMVDFPEATGPKTTIITPNDSERSSGNKGFKVAVEVVLIAAEGDSYPSGRLAVAEVIAMPREKKWWE